MSQGFRQNSPKPKLNLPQNFKEKANALDDQDE
jgi:hypothetical protein